MAETASRPTKTRKLYYEGVGYIQSRGIGVARLLVTALSRVRMHHRTLSAGQLAARADLTHHTRGGAVCDSCLATPSFFFSLLRQPPLTKRTQREILSCKSSLRRGNPRPYPLVPTAVALCKCGDICCIVAIAGVCSEAVCVVVEMRRHSNSSCCC